jgi:excisionase family DNA binding protein
MAELITTPGDGLAVSVRDLNSLLDVQAVAKMLDCSPRHVYRLSDAGRMPAPVKLGSLVRWSRRAIEEWIAAGCKTCRTVGRA